MRTLWGRRVVITFRDGTEREWESARVTAKGGFVWVGQDTWQTLNGQQIMFPTELVQSIEMIEEEGGTASSTTE